MASESTNTQTLSFPRETFKILAGPQFLLANLRPSTSSKSTEVRRPNGRRLNDFRKPTVNKSSLSHANGSAVVRSGDTAAVCGIRGEILLASDVPDHRSSTAASPAQQEREERDEIRNLGLLVPNIELATGCSPAHLPGQPPSALAQTLSSRILALLHVQPILEAEDLRIWHRPTALDSEGGNEVEEEGALQEAEVKAYWTLYIDILFLSLDGNAFDVAWAAVMAALDDLSLPHAYWDVDREMILCDAAPEKARVISPRRRIAAATFVAFSAPWEAGATNAKEGSEEQWILADPDTFEDDQCKESVTIALIGDGERTEIVKIEKKGGGSVGKESMAKIVTLAKRRWIQWADVIWDGDAKKK